MAALEKAVRSIQKDGLVWAQVAKLVPLAFGIKFLQINCVVEDDKVSTDELCEEISETCEEWVQSADVIAMQKI